MRKRKYTVDHSLSIDTFTEDIDQIHQQKYDLQTPVAEVHNLVGTCQIESSVMPLNLMQICKILPNAYFTKQKFAAITLRLQDPLCTVLLFTSGKLVLTGSKTFLECVSSCLRILDILRKGIHGVSFRLTSSVIQNIVGNVNLNLDETQCIDLDAMYRDYSVYCTYQKNMFPGLIFRPLNSPIVLLVFTSGKIVLTGAKSVEAMHMGWQAIWSTVRQHIRRKTPNVSDITRDTSTGIK